MSATPKKAIFITYNEKIALYLLKKGVQVTPLYEADGLTCFRVHLRGRKQCRILEEKEFQEYNTGTEAYLVAYKRLEPPVMTVKVQGQYALLQDAAGAEAPYFMLTKNPELLDGVDGDSEVVTLNTWEEVNEFLNAAKATETPAQVRVFVGYGPHSKVPYRETHDLRTLDLVVTGQLVQQSQKQEEEPAHAE